MKRRSLLVAAVTIFLSVDRLPAPIVEEEKPTPAPIAEQSEAPKRKHSPRSTSSAEESSAEAANKTKPAPASQGPARFAGSWTGKISQGLLGHVPTSVTVNANATSVELNHNLGGGTRPVTINGNIISWKSGVAGEITWTLTPSSDGQTAQVTMKGLLLNDTTTFRRVQRSSP